MRAALGVSGRVEVPTLEEQALYQNLCILGIVNSALKHEGIELGRTTLRRSNNKALEYVLYRLYSIIEGRTRAQKDFKGMLPVLDKVQQAPFYQRIGEWMMELKKAGRLEPSVILPVSALKTNTSNRLVLLLLELSTVALQQDTENACPGITQAAYLPTPGSAATGSGGLLDDVLIPGELRVAVSVARAKLACSDCLSAVASASNICNVMEQHSLEFKQHYYELQAELRQQEVAKAELENSVPGAADIVPPSSSLFGGNTSSFTSAGAGSDSLHGSTALGHAFSTPASADLSTTRGVAVQPQPSPRHQGPSCSQPNPEALAAVSALWASMKQHLAVHEELSAALMTEGADSKDRGSPADGWRQGSSTASGGSGLRFGHPQQQVLHPYQIDGRAIATEALAAVAITDAAARVSGTLGFEQATQRRQQRNMLMPYGPDNVVKAFMSFASLLSSLAPHVTQLAMSGENAGPLPLLQPPSHPSGHAAHVAHQLQVHGNASRQIAQLSRKVQDQAAAQVPIVRALRLESSRAIMNRYDLPGHEALDDDFSDMVPHLALPPALTLPSRSINAPILSFGSSPKPSGLGEATGSSGAPSAVAMGSPCTSSAGAFLTGTIGSGASGCGSASAMAYVSSVITTSTTSAPVDDGLAKIHARMRSLNIQSSSAVSLSPATAIVLNSTNEAPVSSTCSIATGGEVLVSTVMSMFSPPSTMLGISASPMAMSGPAGPRPTRSPVAQTTNNIHVYTARLAMHDIASPLRSASGQRPHLGGALVSGDAMGLQQQARTSEAGRDLSDADGSNNSITRAQTMQIGAAALGGAVSVPEAATAAPQPWAVSVEQARPGWPLVPPLKLPTNPVPASCRSLNPLFVEQQHRQAHAHNLKLAGSSGEALGPPPAVLSTNSGGRGLACSTSGTTVVSQWHQPHMDALRPKGPPAADGNQATSNPSGRADTSPTMEWNPSRADSRYAPFSNGNDGTKPNLTAVWLAPDGGHTVASKNSRRLDLGRLLDDDDDDINGGHGLGSQRLGGPLTGTFSNATLARIGKAPAATPTSLLPPSNGSPLGLSGLSIISAPLVFQGDADEDFGVLAAEGELVSQVLMHGGTHAPPVLIDNSSGAWGSCSGAVTDGGEGNNSRATLAGRAIWAHSSPGGFGHMDVDHGDDVVMVDNDKDVSPSFGAKGFPGNWVDAGVATSGGARPASQQNRLKSGNLFDAFGALVSPHPLQGHENSFGPVPPQPTADIAALSATDGFGADFMALKARVQAVLTKP